MSIGIFLLVAIGGVSSVWSIAYLLGAFDAGPGSAWAQGVVVLGAFAPALACLVVRRWVAREGFSDAGLTPEVAKLLALLRLWLGRCAPGGRRSRCVGAGRIRRVNAIVLRQRVRLARSPAVAGGATGLIWGVFHYPLILLASRVTRTPQSASSFFRCS